MESKLKIVLFSDLHFTDCLHDNFDMEKSNKLLQYSLPLLDELTKRVNNVIKPDVVICLGDLIQDNNDHNTDLNRIKLVWKFFQNLKKPFYTLLGNHDLKTMNSRVEAEKAIGYERSTFSIDINNYHLVFLGTEVDRSISIASGGIERTRTISEDDLKWLNDDLEKSKNPSLVFCHYGTAEDDMKGNRQFENKPEDGLIKNRKDLKVILENKGNVIGVFSGHQHWTKMIKENGINYYLVGSLIENIDKKGTPDGVYLEVEADENKPNIIENHIKVNRKMSKEDFEKYINRRVEQINNKDYER